MKPPPPPPEKPPELPPEKPPLRELLELEPKLLLRDALELEVVGVVERLVPNELTRLVLLVVVPRF